jgi:hypothetical protein
MTDELQWRLASINAELDRLPMIAAQWNTLDDLHRTDVRLRWGWCVCEHVNHIRREWRRYRDGSDHPEWWVMLQLRVEEVEALIVALDLPMPDVRIVSDYPQRPRDRAHSGSRRCRQPRSRAP